MSLLVHDYPIKLQSMGRPQAVYERQTYPLVDKYSVWMVKVNETLLSIVPEFVCSFLFSSILSIPTFFQHYMLNTIFINRILVITKW